MTTCIWPQVYEFIHTANSKNTSLSVDYDCNNDIIYQDNDFILLRDIIWDGKDINKLYMLAIPKNSTKRSIRDLSSRSFN